MKFWSLFASRAHSPARPTSAGGINRLISARAAAQSDGKEAEALGLRFSLRTGVDRRREFITVSFVPHYWPRRRSEVQESWSEWQDLNLRPPRPERGALPATAHLLSSSLSADNFRLMTLGRRGPRQSDPWSASPSDNLPFCWSWSDRDQHVISLILASTLVAKA